MPAKIQPLPDGPLKVEGEFQIAKADGSEIPHKAEAYLCRCGGSANKPFCDGSHKKAGFKAD